MPKYKLRLVRREIMEDSRVYEVEAEDEFDAQEKLNEAWENYNAGFTEGIVLDGESYNVPEPEEIVDGESWVEVV